MMDTLILTNGMGVFFLHFLLKDIDRIIKIGRLPPVGAGCRNQEASKDETIF